MTLESDSNSVLPSKEPIDGMTPQAEANQKSGQPPADPPFRPDVNPAPEHKKHSEHCRPDQTPIGKHILEVLAAGILAAYTVAAFQQLGVMSDTLTEIRNGKEDTKRIITASEAQACAAKSFAASAAKINAGIGTAVGKLNLQAEKLEANVKQATRLAKATEDANTNAANADRPWIGAFFSASNFESGKAPTYTVTFINSGRRPAKVDLTATQASPYVVFPQEPRYVVDTLQSTSVLVPNQPSVSTWVGKDTDFVAATTPGQVFYVYAKAEYRDARDNSPYWTHVCWRYLSNSETPSVKWTNCSGYNDAK